MDDLFWSLISQGYAAGFPSQPPSNTSPPPHIHKEKLGEEVKTEEKQLVHGKERGKSLSPGHGIKDNGYTLRDSHTGFPRSPQGNEKSFGD